MGSGWGGAHCDITKGQAWLVLSLQVPGQTSTPGAVSSRLTMWSVKWFLCFSMAVTHVYALMFTSVREKAEELKSQVLCGGHCLIQQNQPEHAQDWFKIVLLGLFFIVLMYVTVELTGESGESNVQTPPARQGGSFGSLGQKKKKASPDKDYMFATLTQLEMDLVKFVSRVRNLKLAAATCGNLNPPNVEVPAAHNNITLYELWCDEDSE
ncbi:protein FAM209-like [Dama dama]|uniref:protein FAM209-like n=1 Tax=Dama dama TaxID=30532 RepID=UPI002A36AB89|nr:protein FAM209-like [Dama dama]